MFFIELAFFAFTSNSATAVASSSDSLCWTGIVVADDGIFNVACAFSFKIAFGSW